MNDTYQPTVIANQDLPLLGGGIVAQPLSNPSNTASKGSEQPQTVQNLVIPRPIIASDVIGMTLDTQQGSIINPLDVIHQGKLRSLQQDNILDTIGIRSNTQFTGTQLLVSAVTQTTVNTSGWDDVPGSSFSITADRDLIYLFSLFLAGYNDGNALNDYTLKVRLYDSFLGGPLITLADLEGKNTTRGISAHMNLNLLIDFGASSYSYNDSISTSYSIHTSPEYESLVVPLPVEQGQHDYKLQFQVSGGGNGKLTSFLLYTSQFGT